MKYAAFTISIFLLISSLSMTSGDDKPNGTTRRGVAQDPVEENARFPDAYRKQECPPSPQPKDWLMIPHGGVKSEGCARVNLQDLELNFDATKAASDQIRKLMLAQDSALTAERKERLRLENAVDLTTSLDDFVRDKAAMIALGKAFFWDQQIGSDGQTACASCHFKAGADGRGRSLGMALRRMTGEAPLADGTEPSRPLVSDDFLKMYQFRWGGMIDFDQFVASLVQRAVARLEAEASTGVFPYASVHKELIEIQILDSAPTEISVAWKRLIEALSGKDDIGGEQGEVRTISSLAVDGMLFVGYAKVATASQKRKSTDELAQLKGRWQNYTDDQLQGVSGLGAALAPNEAERLTELPEAVRISIPMNAPTVINAALYDRLFHNARAASVFNGYDHLGDSAGRDGYGKWVCRNGRWHRTLVRIPDAALASQATAPLLSSAEMSWFGRQYHHVARKILNRRPLQFQAISQNDSHLQPWLVNGQLDTTYRQLIQKAFKPEWWCGGRVPRVEEHDALTGMELELDQVEANFSLFWGIALMYYQNELISNTSEFDRLMSLRLQGKPLFEGQAAEESKRIRAILSGYKTFQEHACADCHRAPEFADATRATVYGPMLEFEGPLDAINAETETNEFADFLGSGKAGLDSRIERMPFRPEHAPRFYDAGIYNIGVTSDREGTEGYNPGVAGEVWLNFQNENEALTSIGQQFGQGLVTDLLARKIPVTFSLARRHADDWSNVVGSFKTPTMRNVELTGPYFHDGDQNRYATLDQVLEHYDIAQNNLGIENEFLHPALRLEPGAVQRETAIPDSLRPDVIAFLKSLTDPRVRENIAPFDHPTLQVPVVPQVDPMGRTHAPDLKPDTAF
ncbi:MAG: hypothetical protein JNM43_29475 [Planctomycetaceae bacterium]|nr:hypothetical protein [Planctomycetaceae bacterium]